jgi:hypothetical protein
MPNENFIFPELILACRNYLAVQNVKPSNYYEQVRQIQNAAITSDPNDIQSLKRLSAELERLGCYWSPGQRAAYNRSVDELKKPKAKRLRDEP